MAVGLSVTGPRGKTSPSRLGFGRALAGAFPLRALAAALTLGLQMLTTRLLGADAFGDYAFALSWINGLAVICLLGFDASSLRFVAAYHGQGEWGLLRGFIRRSAAYAVLAALTGAGLTAATALLVYRGPQSGLGQVIAVGALLLPVMTSIQLLASQLLGLRKTAMGIVVQGLVRPVAVAGALLLALAFAERPFDALFAIGLNVGASAVTLAIAWAVWRRVFRSVPREAISVAANRAWLLSSLTQLLVVLAQVVLEKTDVLMVGTLRTTREAGIYAVASQLATLTTFAVHAANSFVAPSIADLYARNRPAELQRLLTIASRGMTLYALPAALLLALAGGPLLGLLYPAPFVAGSTVLTILALGQLVIALCGPAGFLLTMTGHERQASRIILGSATLNIVLNAALIPRWGIAGAATATAIATAARSITLSLAARRMGFDPTVLGRPPRRRP